MDAVDKCFVLIIIFTYGLFRCNKFFRTLIYRKDGGLKNPVATFSLHLSVRGIREINHSQADAGASDREEIISPSSRAFYEGDVHISPLFTKKESIVFSMRDDGEPSSRD